MTQADLFVPDDVPDAAADMLRKLWRDHPHQRDRGRIHRLATFEIMRANVWQVLPKEPAGLEGEIIYSAFYWSSREMANIVKTGKFPTPTLSFEEIAKHLVMVRKALIERESSVREEWSRRADQFQLPHFQDSLESIEDLHKIIDSFIEEERDVIRGFPKVRKKRSDKVEEIICSKMMAVRMIEFYGDPLHTVVIALVDAIFDKKGSTPIETQRSRFADFLKQFEH